MQGNSPEARKDGELGSGEGRSVEDKVGVGPGYHVGLGKWQLCLSQEKLLTQ